MIVPFGGEAPDKVLLNLFSPQGGQRQRIAIARAAYSDADIYVLDDPLSALDARVARQVFETCLNGTLKDHTRVMATNQVHFLPKCDVVVYMDKVNFYALIEFNRVQLMKSSIISPNVFVLFNQLIDFRVINVKGRIVAQGSYQNLIETSSAFKQFVGEVSSNRSHDNHPATICSVFAFQQNSRVLRPITQGSKKNYMLSLSVQFVAEEEDEEITVNVTQDTEKSTTNKAPTTSAPTQLVKEEHREVGLVDRRVIWYYVNAMGGKPKFFYLIFSYVLSEVLRLLTRLGFSVKFNFYEISIIVFGLLIE
jgi:energy-coupling factor transporter ATP-binding protein EcfA2